MVIQAKRTIMKSVLGLALVAMILAAIYKSAWLLLGVVTSGATPRSIFDVANLMEGPAYLISAATSWKWPWLAESASILTLFIIFARFHPWATSPFQRGLSVDYVFIAAANVIFFIKLALSRVERRSN